MGAYQATSSSVHPFCIVFLLGTVLCVHEMVSNGQRLGVAASLVKTAVRAVAWLYIGCMLGASWLYITNTVAGVQSQTPWLAAKHP